MPTPLLQVRAVRKSFGGVEVLKGIHFDVEPGEVHAVCGENGAGKSTLMNIIAGVHKPDSGELLVDGHNVGTFASAQAARAAGIGIVFQERSLFRPLTVAENIFAGRQPLKRWGIIDRARLHREAGLLLAEVAPDVEAQDMVVDLTPAQQQMVEIAKALSLQARVLILDEPTAALTETETARLFAVIRQLRNRGVGLVYISHRLEEIFALADRVTVLKDGFWQGTSRVVETTPEKLIRQMVGRDVEQAEACAISAAAPVLLEVEGLSDGPEHKHGVTLQNVSFNARAGEVIGLAGLAGAGRTETALSIFGARPYRSGAIRIEGQTIAPGSPREAIQAGFGYVSEDRKETGLFLEMSVRRNISAASLGHFGSWFYRDREEAKVARDFRDKLRIICATVDQDTGHLSGGNQQKVLLARWLLVNPRVLMVDEPTRGVDVGAKVEVHQLLREFARQGHAVLMISSDLPEILTVSDRIYVMRTGQILGELARADASEEAIMRLAAG